MMRYGVVNENKGAKDKRQKQLLWGLIAVLAMFFVFITNTIFGFFVENNTDVPEFFFTDYLLEMIETAQIINPNRLPQSIDHLELTFLPIEAGVGSGGLFAWTGISHDELMERIDDRNYFYGFGGMRHNSPQDLFTVFVSNGFEYDLNILVKLFYNFEEVPFMISGSSYYQTEFIFTLPAMYDVHIPVQLDSRLEVNEFLSSRLTVAYFLVPELHIGESIDFRGSSVDGMALNFEIDYGSNDRHFHLPLTDLPYYPLPELATGFMINRDFTPTNAGRSIQVPPYLLQVSPGEKIDLSLVVNGNWFLTLEEMESYLVIAMLDFRQILMSGQPFLHFAASQGQHVPFTIVAPMEPGMHEFTALAVHNPMQPLRNSNFFSVATDLSFHSQSCR